MERVADLPEKLDAALKALSMSRVALAQRLGVDKSLVGRWLSGAVHPTEHNLSRLSAVIADAIPSFRLADWYADLDSFGEVLGTEMRPKIRSGEEPWAEFLGTAHSEMAFRGSAYEGFWRTSRPSILIPDRIFHEYGMIRRNRKGIIEVLMRGAGLEFSGQLVPSGSNVFVFLYDRTGRTPMTVLFKGVSLPKAMALEGILLLAALDSNRTPAAVPLVIERVADLTGDHDADDAIFARMAVELPSPLDAIAEDRLKERLFRNVGPNAAICGGEMFLTIMPSDTLSRGSAEDGLIG